MLFKLLDEHNAQDGRYQGGKWKSMRVYSGRDECSKYIISDISEVGWNPKTVRTTDGTVMVSDLIN
jgi:hypothetical protein